MFEYRGIGVHNNLAKLWCLLIALALSTDISAQIGLPDTARPGAVRPEEAGEPVVPEVDVLEVPAVIDRPFEIDEGDHVFVKQFRLLDVKDFPKFGVKLAELQEILQRLIEEKPEGFTI